MTSTIKVDTISEKTSANGVAVDGVTLKDNGITASGDISFDGGSFVFNESSADVDFRIETNGNANMLFVSGGNDVVGIGAEGDLGVGLHVKSADSGASVNANRDELVLENSAHCGMTILSGTSSVGGVGFGDSDGNLQGLMQYNHATDNFEFNTNSTQTPLVLNSGGQLSTNAEVSPDVDVGGICINYGANDNQFFTVKNSDVAHVMTRVSETDTMLSMSKVQAANANLSIQANQVKQDIFYKMDERLSGLSSGYQDLASIIEGLV